MTVSRGGESLPREVRRWPRRQSSSNLGVSGALEKRAERKTAASGALRSHRSVPHLGKCLCGSDQYIQIRGDIRNGGTVHVELRQPVAPGLLPSLQSRVLQSIWIVVQMKATTVVILPCPPASALRTTQNADWIKSSASALLPSLFASVPHAMPLLCVCVFGLRLKMSYC